MSEADYSNREINEKMDHLKEILLRVEAQTTRTNGRVTSLEIKHEGMFAKVGAIATVVSAGVIAIINRVI